MHVIFSYFQFIYVDLLIMNARICTCMQVWQNRYTICFCCYPHVYLAMFFHKHRLIQIKIFPTFRIRCLMSELEFLCTTKFFIYTGFLRSIDLILVVNYRTYFDTKNKDVDSSSYLNIVNNDNQSSQKFRQTFQKFIFFNTSNFDFHDTCFKFRFCSLFIKCVFFEFQCSLVFWNYYECDDTCKKSN